MTEERRRPTRRLKKPDPERQKELREKYPEGKTRLPKRRKIPPVEPKKTLLSGWYRVTPNAGGNFSVLHTIFSKQDMRDRKKYRKMELAVMTVFGMVILVVSIVLTYTLSCLIFGV